MGLVFLYILCSLLFLPSSFANEPTPLFTIAGVKQFSYNKRDAICYIDLNDDARCVSIEDPQQIGPPFAKAKAIHIGHSGGGISIATVGLDDKFHGFETEILTPHQVRELNWELSLDGDDKPITKEDVEKLDIVSAQTGDWVSDSFCVITKNKELKCFSGYYTGVSLESSLPRNNISAVSVYAGSVCVLLDIPEGNLRCSRMHLDIPEELSDIHFESLRLEEITCAQANERTLYCWGYSLFQHATTSFIKISSKFKIGSYSAAYTIGGWVVCTASGNSVNCSVNGNRPPFPTFLYLEGVQIRDHDVGMFRLVVLGEDNLLRIY